jgi:uncharacterized protein
MRFLIDGYNLMHAVGYVVPKGTETQFHAARLRFLDWLADEIGKVAIKVELRIVFDAQHSKKDLGSSAHRGLIVQFSFRETADDLIETLLHRETKPGDVTLVSNDTRLQKAAKRANCKHVACSTFVDWLQQPSGWKETTPDNPMQEKPALDAKAEVDQFFDIFNSPK